MTLACLRKLVPIIAVLCLALGAFAETPSQCGALPGAEKLWSTPNLRFVLAGETHGTAESPAAFRDLVCTAQSLGRPIVVGIERSPREQKAIDAFMAPGSHEAAIGALLAEAGWNMFDGRSSRAMFTLLGALRGMKLKGEIAHVVAFADTRPGESVEQGEERMASALMAAANRYADSLVIALTGNLHASRKPIEGFGAYPLLGMRLPAAQSISLLVIDKGGEAWNQMDDKCGPHKQGSSGGVRRGIVLSESAAPISGYDGVLSTGLPLTASGPAIKDAPPPPACSKQ